MLGSVRFRLQTASPPRQVLCSPARHVRGHERLEQRPVVREAQVQQFVSDDEVLEVRLAVCQIRCQRDRARRRA